jgi:anti-sigma-K factor RskA
MNASTEIDDDDGWLAAEFALGVLDADRRSQAQARYDADSAFRAEVEDWTARLSPMLDGLPDETPSPRVWAYVRAHLDAERGSAAQPRRRPRDGPWRNVRVWRAATAGALALAAASWLVNLTPTAPVALPAAPLRSPVLAAALNAEAGDPLFAVMVDRDRAQVAVVPLLPWTADRARELWLIPGDGVPRSLGLIEAGRPTPLPLPPELRTAAHASVTFAVSDEPAGGSPDAGPSGPVLATGTLASL